MPSLAQSAESVPFALCSKYNPRLMYELYQPFVDYLGEQTPYRFEIKLSRSYEETVRMLGEGKTPIASCGPVPYIMARKKYPVRPILRALSADGTPFYRSIIVVRKESAIQKLSDLKGKRFAFGQSWSTAGHVLPQYSLALAGIRLGDLKQYMFFRHHDSVARAVLRGEFDAGAVKDVVAQRCEQQGLRCLFVSEPISTVPIVVHNRAPKNVVSSVTKALLTLDRGNPSDRQRMAEWDEEFQHGFTTASDADYDRVRFILDALLKDPQMKRLMQGG